MRFEGVITKFTAMGSDCIVTLSKPVNGLKFAVVSEGTTGRVKLMNDKKWDIGISVSGRGNRGVEAIMALEIEATI